MARLKDIFGLSRNRETEMLADEVREETGDFVVWIMDMDTGVHLRDRRFSSAQEFADEIKTGVMKSNEEAFDLSGKDLRGIDFSDTSELYGAKFEGCDLTGTKFMHSDLTGGNFKNCIMHDVDMEGAIIRYADFSHADLKGAFMEQAKANRTKFTHVKAVGAHLGGLIAPDTDFIQADLTNAVTTGMDIKGANLHFAKITRAQLAACKNADKAQYMTASHLVHRAGRARRNKPS